MSAVDPTSAVLEGLAVQRASGAPALACLAGYRAVDDERAGTTLTAAADAAGTAGATDLAMLVDLAAGAAVRRRTGAGRRLATSAMAVHLLAPLPATAALAVHVPALAVRERSAVVTATVLADDDVIGTGSLAFTLLGDGLTPIPWEHPGPRVAGALTEDELTADERAVLVHVRAAGGLSWAEAVLQGSTASDGNGLVLVPSGPLANRAGTLQGGALVGLAVLAAGSGVLSSVQVDFTAAASVDAPVHARVEVLREGRRSRLVQVGLVQAGVPVVTATVGLRTA